MPRISVIRCKAYQDKDNIHITQNVVIAQYEYCPAILAPYKLCHTSYVQSNVYIVQTIVQSPVRLMLPVLATHTPGLQLHADLCKGPYKPIFCLPYNKASNKGQRSCSQGSTVDIASSPGHSHVFNVARRLKTWEWPGDKATTDNQLSL